MRATTTWDAVREEITALAELPDDQDAGEASRITQEAIARAIEISRELESMGMPPPDMLPTEDGHIYFEWHGNAQIEAT